MGIKIKAGDKVLVRETPPPCIKDKVVFAVSDCGGYFQAKYGDWEKIADLDVVGVVSGGVTECE